MHQLVVMRLTTMQVDLRTPVRVSVGTQSRQTQLRAAWSSFRRGPHSEEVTCTSSMSSKAANKLAEALELEARITITLLTEDDTHQPKSSREIQLEDKVVALQKENELLQTRLGSMRK